LSVVYQINLANSVEAMHFIPLSHNECGINFTSWKEAAEFLELTIEKTRYLLESEFKFTTERLNKLEEEQNVEPDLNETEIVTFNIRKTTDDGYWNTAKHKESSGGRKITIEPGPGLRQRSDQNRRSNWLDPIVTTPEGATVIFSRYKPGRHGRGGQYTIMVAVPSLT